MSSKVLIIGIDGVRWDSLQAVDTPTIDALAERGFIAPVWVNDIAPSDSGPAWSTIFTGALADRHGIFGNDLSPNHLDAHPDLVELARQQRPEVQTFVAAAWAPLVAADSGGPLFAGGGWLPQGAPPHLPHEWQEADQAVTDESVRRIRELDAERDALVITYLGGVDETAHLLGVGDEYLAFITDSDRRTGELLDAIGSRDDADDWTVLVVTDHGHLDPGGHGGGTVLERTAWIAAAGPGIATSAPALLEQADIAGHAAWVLGLRLPDGCIGVRLGAR